MEPERRSACMEKVKEAERARIRAMTPAQRIALALQINRRAQKLAALGKKLNGG